MKQLGLRDIAKRSFAIYSAYKLLRDFRQIPNGRLGEFDAIWAISRVLPNTMLPMPRLFDLFNIVKRINGEAVPGSLVECGVWSGGSVGLIALANRMHPGPRRILHLFDSFEGLPQPTVDDAKVYVDYVSSQKKQDATDAGTLGPIGACVGGSQAAVEEFLVKRLGIVKDGLEFHVGWFKIQSPNAGIPSAKSLCSDWTAIGTSSTKVCIDNLYDNVVPGGFVIIDDYGTFEGCKKAIDEFFDGRRRHPQFEYSDFWLYIFSKGLIRSGAQYRRAASIAPTAGAICWG